MFTLHQHILCSFLEQAQSKPHMWKLILSPFTFSFIFRAGNNWHMFYNHTFKLNNYSYGKYLVYRGRHPCDRMAHWFPGIFGRRADSYPACSGGNIRAGQHNPWQKRIAGCQDKRMIINPGGEAMSDDHSFLVNLCHERYCRHNAFLQKTCV